MNVLLLESIHVVEEIFGIPDPIQENCASHPIITWKINLHLELLRFSPSFTIVASSPSSMIIKLIIFLFITERTPILEFLIAFLKTWPVALVFYFLGVVFFGTSCPAFFLGDFLVENENFLAVQISVNGQQAYSWGSWREDCYFLRLLFLTSIPTSWLVSPSPIGPRNFLIALMQKLM